MATEFRRPILGPTHISAEPQREAVPGESLVPGLDHRPFSDKEIKQAFDTFDLDNNRFVGAAEIRHIVKLIGEEVTDEEVDEMIRMCDTDGDGQVTFDEFYKLMTQPPPPVPVQVPQATRRIRTTAKKYLKTATSQASLAPTRTTPTSAKQKPIDDEKKMQAKEFRSTSIEALVERLSGSVGKIKPAMVKKVYKRFQDIDLDHSGYIDYEEFIKALDMEDNVISREMFRVFDMDGSGSIELKEFIVVLSRYTSAAKSEKLKFAFLMFDQDGSGKIERAELVNMLQASFIVEGYTRDELEERADAVYEFLALPKDASISFEDFLRLSSSKNGLIYPLEEERHALGKDVSINKYLEEH